MEGGHANQSLPRCRHPHAEGYFCSCQMCWVQGGGWPSCAERAEVGCVLRASRVPCIRPLSHASPGPPTIPWSSVWHGAWLCSETHAGPQPSCASRPPPPACVHTAGGFGSASLPPKGELSWQERNSVAPTVAHAHHPPCTPSVSPKSWQGRRPLLQHLRQRLCCMLGCRDLSWNTARQGQRAAARHLSRGWIWAGGPCWDPL